MEFLFTSRWATAELLLLVIAVIVLIVILISYARAYWTEIFAMIFGPHKRVADVIEPYHEAISLETGEEIRIEHPVFEPEDTITDSAEDTVDQGESGDAPMSEIEGVLDISSPPPEDDVAPTEYLEPAAPTRSKKKKSAPTEAEEPKKPRRKKAEEPINVAPPEPKNIKTENVEVLFGITNQAKTFIARGQHLEARGLIIQGLALDQEHRDLNMMLAHLYEQDGQYKKAELVYKDIATLNPNDVEILERLANILIIEKRFPIAIEMYRKIIDISGETEESIYILIHLSKELGETEQVYTYAKKYQKNWPNNPEILAVLAEAEISLGHRKGAIQTLLKLKNLTPYNEEIGETIQKLMMEEEMAGNFNGK